VQADADVEREAVRRGLLAETFPDDIWRRYVLGWGYGSRAEAATALDVLQPVVAEALRQLAGLERPLEIT
jgi:hypothetical protein